MSVFAPDRLRRTAPAPNSGIVHLGLGAFFRAHGAIYLQQSMAQCGGDWGVVGVSLRSPDVRDRLAGQDNLYTALEMSALGPKPRIVDSITGVLFAPEDPDAVLTAMAAETTRIVSLTVTEKGYYRGSGAGVIDWDHADIRHDLEADHPKTAVGYLVRALGIRRHRGLRPFTILSLDNLPANGVLTRALVCGFAERIDADLARWIAAECKFPGTMVDRIVPATPESVNQRFHDTSTYTDRALVTHEPFCQWVIEDDFVDGVRPALDVAGAQFVADVGPYEDMKLRMLNGSHSALAYLGHLAGYETVAQAIGDKSLMRFVTALWRDEMAPSLTAPAGTDLQAYAMQLLERYQNPEIRHLLAQIAVDGSQKLPQRIVAPLFENRAAGRPYTKLLTVLAAWFRFIERRATIDQAPLDDPLAHDLMNAARNASDDSELVRNLLETGFMFGGYPTSEIAAELIALLGQNGTFDDPARLGGPP